jgi:predicted enzyme related to lactoylglutathione lyase
MSYPDARYLMGRGRGNGYTTAVDKDQNPIEPGGINGGFYKRKSKDDHPSFGVQTGSIDKTLKAREKAGGKIITPKHSIGQWVLWRTSRIRRAT